MQQFLDPKIVLPRIWLHFWSGFPSRFSEKPNSALYKSLQWCGLIYPIQRRVTRSMFTGSSNACHWLKKWHCFVYVNTSTLGESYCIWSLIFSKPLPTVEALSFSATILWMCTAKLWGIHIVEGAPTFLATTLAFYVNCYIAQKAFSNLLYLSDSLQRILVEFVHLLQDKIKIIKMFPFFHCTSNTLL